MTLDAILIFLLIIFFVNNIDCEQSCREVPSERKTSFLWKIRTDQSDKDNYIFGTIHVNYKEVWDTVPVEAKAAIYDSDAVFLEISNQDVQQLTSEFSCKLLENGRTLEDFLSADDYETVENFMANVYGLVTTDQNEDFLNYLNYTIVTNWKTKKPLALFMELEQFFGDMTVPEFSQEFTEAVLDDYIEMLGKNFNKTIGSLEAIERECYIYEEPEQEAWILKYLPIHFDLSNATLVNISANPDVVKDDLYNETTKFMSDYKCGIYTFDMDEHDISLRIDDVDEEDKKKLKKLNEKLQHAFYKRNFNMAAKIHDLLTKNPSISYFFAFGYGHLFGKHNVRHSLESKYGFKVAEVKKSTILNTLWMNVNKASEEIPNREISKNKNGFDTLRKELPSLSNANQISLTLCLFTLFLHFFT